MFRPIGTPLKRGSYIREGLLKDVILYLRKYQISLRSGVEREAGGQSTEIRYTQSSEISETGIRGNRRNAY